MPALKSNSLIGNYKVIGLLGSGAMGTVYRCKNSNSNDPIEYAIKVFTPDTNLTTSQLEEMSARFRLEGEVLKKIDHPNVVRVFEAGVDSVGDYIVMELLEGFNLKELLEMGTTFDLNTILDIVRQLLGALAVCHQKRIIHRDVKPANLVRINDGRIVLTDFGIVRQLGEGTLSVNKQIVGTPNYMSPEQIKGYSVDRQSDIWSTGVVFYELLSRQKPFEGTELTQTLYNITNIQPVSPRIYNPQITEKLERIILKCLAKEPSTRFQNTSELIRELDFLDSSENIPITDQKNIGWVSNPLDQNNHFESSDQPVQTYSQSTNDYAVSSYDPMDFSTPKVQPVISIPDDIHKVKIYCIECGTQNYEDDSNCSKCRAPIITRETLNKRIRVIQQVFNNNAENTAPMQPIPVIIYQMIGVVNLILALGVLYSIYVFFKSSQ